MTKLSSVSGLVFLSVLLEFMAPGKRSHDFDSVTCIGNVLCMALHRYMGTNVLFTYFI